MNWLNFLKKHESKKSYTNVSACVELLEKLGIQPNRYNGGTLGMSEPARDFSQVAMFTLGLVMAITGFVVVALSMFGMLSIGWELAGISVGIFGSVMVMAAPVKP